jgi:glycosyltransferase involved in cell wall biosynthesis
MLMARELGPGGTERQLTEIARALDRSLFEVHVGCFHEGIRSEELRRAGIRVVRFPVTSFLRPNAMRGAWQLGSYLRAHRIQIAHTFDYPLNCFGVPVARAFRIPVVLSSQRAHRDLTPAFYRKILGFTDKLVDGIVVNSEAVRQDLVANERLPCSLLHLCYNGIDLSRFHPAARRRCPGLENASLVIGVVCVLRPEKGLPTLLKAFAQSAALDENARLLIVGSGSELSGLQALADQLGVRPRCVFQPAVSDVAPWLESIDIFVLPSLSEALSNSLMEAMAAGCTCIASDIGGNPELVRPHHTGLMFQPGNADDLTTALDSLVADGRFRTELARASTRLIHEQFSLAASADRMTCIYRSFLDRKAPLGNSR